MASLLAALAILALAGVAEAQSSTTVHGTETLVIDYVGDNGPANEAVYGDDDEFWAFRDVFDLGLVAPGVETGLRFDAALFARPPAPVDPERFVWGEGASGYTLLNYEDDFRLERIYGTAKLGELRLTAGDFYVSFGRGMILSLVKLDDLGVDNALRGGRVEYAPGDRLKLTLVGGVVNSVNVDVITHAVRPDDPLDRIAGARVELRAAEPLMVGLHGVVMRPRFTDEADIAPERLYVDQAPGVAVESGGGFAELSSGAFYAYVEIDAQRHERTRQRYEAPDWESDRVSEPGQALFGELSYAFKAVGLKGEGFYYRRWVMEGPPLGPVNEYTLARPMAYSQLVTFEPRWLPNRSLGNEAGGRLTADTLIARSDTQITASAAALGYLGAWTRQGDWSDHADVFVAHPRIELRQGFPGTKLWISANGGYREELDTGRRDDTGSLWHVGVETLVPLSGPHGIDAAGELRRHELYVTEGPRPYWVATASLRYDWASRFSVGAMYEYSDQSPGERASISGWELPLPRQHYLMGVVSGQAKIPGGTLVLRLYGGSQRGGVKCTGGVCREYPDSVGVRLEATYRF
ncbi:MAG: DUF6029 family protein [Proteobacteria bacterium]|jgi:hypothetical protein|nr:DUF6029 family protein [Pseudomonadota bacterium]